MVEAQRYPFDFNGIIAGAPDMDESDLAVRGIWIKQNFLGRDDKPVLNSDDIQLLHQAVLEQCDMEDGLKDGIVGDALHCSFDPAQLQCKSGQTSHCLNASQVQAVKNIYGAPRNSSGMQLSSRGVLPGSEIEWAGNFSETWGDAYGSTILTVITRAAASECFFPTTTPIFAYSRPQAASS